MPMSLPEPDSESRAQLDLLAQNMIAEATSVDDHRILSATGFARENISILHQQIRATNLAWALGWMGRVKPGDTIGIVGGSFSGITLAVILALVNDAIVLIFEKDNEPLERFRDKSHRHLSRNLNSRALGKSFDPHWSSPEFRSPIFAWEPGPASKVAAFWIDEFARYDAQLPIFVVPDTTVTPTMIADRSEGLTIDFAAEAAHLRALPVDLLIDATGFGAEANPLGLTDYSYWEAGHRLIYDHLVPPARVLISGCGDSGVIEAWHYALNGFEHGQVTDDEIDALRRTGITLSTIETLRARLDAQVQAGALSTGDADGLFAASPFHSDQHGARANKYWMTSHPVAPDDSGVELLVGHWGGEVTYFWLRDQALLDRVAALGRGRVVEVAVPVAATRHSYSAGEAVVATFARALGCKPDKKAFDLYTARPLEPEAILSVHSDGDADYLALGSGFPSGYVDTDVGHYDEILAEMDIIRQQRR